MIQAHMLYNLLKDVFLLLDNGDNHLFDQFNLSEARFYALYHIGDEPGISSSRLSLRMFCDKSNITRLIKGMESEQLVERRRHETDGRTQRLFLTDKGETVRQQALTAHKDFNIQRFKASMSETDQQTLYDALNQLKQGLTQQLEQNL